MEDTDKLTELLRKTSRTFALTIPFLPEPTRREVGVAYLLFRIIDTFEDGTRWAPARRNDALAEFAELIEHPDAEHATVASARWTRDPPLEHAGYMELMACTPIVLEWHARLRPEARTQISRHVVRTAKGMAEFVRRSQGKGYLWLETLQDLRDYCLAVAGIVGEMLTELYLLESPALAPVAADLRARAVRFGEGLQLVNILKDAQHDAAEGRVYLPRQLPLADVFTLARADLTVALEYTEILRAAHAEIGLVAFNALNARLALATLSVLRAQGPGSKLSRLELTGLTADVMSRIRSGATLFPEP